MTRHAEFDRHAENYNANSDDPVKRLIGKDLDTFIRPKVEQLVQELRRRPLVGEHPRLLDFGCGTGELLRAIQDRRLSFEVEGCDVSRSMLDTGRARWRTGPVPQLHALDGAELPFDDESFDVIVASCVFHHIAPAERDAVVTQLARILRPGGRLMVIEHNPVNPVTRWMVSRAPIDRDAVLLRSGEMIDRFRRAGLETAPASFFLFLPPRLSSGPVDALLRRVPLGGQYAVVGYRGAAPTGHE